MLKSLARVFARLTGARINNNPGDTAVIPLILTLATQVAPVIVDLVQRAKGPGNGSAKKELAADAISQIVERVAKAAGHPIGSVDGNALSDIIEAAVVAMKAAGVGNGAPQTPVAPTVQPLPTKVTVTESWASLVNMCIEALSAGERTVTIDREDMRAIIAANAGTKS